MSRVDTQVQEVRAWSRQMVRELGFLQPHVARSTTHSQCHCLIELSRQGPLGVMKLAQALRLDKSSTSRLVRELADRAWIEVEPDPRDARGRIVTLLPAGRRALAAIDADADARVLAALGTLTEPQRELVVQGLTLYATALENARLLDALTIRPMRHEDDAAVAHVIRTVMPEFGCVGPGFALGDAEVAAMSRAYRGKRAAYFVVERDGEVVGGAGIAPLAGGPADTCELRKMYFLPAVRGRGLGRRMLATCLDAARRKGYARCYLETLASMTAANRLYRSFGFRPLPALLGETGHFSCDTWYALDL